MEEDVGVVLWITGPKCLNHPILPKSKSQKGQMRKTKQERIC